MPKKGNSDQKQKKDWKSSLTNVLSVGEDLLEGILQVVSLTILYYKWLMKEHCVGKILQSI